MDTSVFGVLIKILKMSRNKHKETESMLLQFIDFFIQWWLPKEPFVSSSVYQRVFLSKSSFKGLNFAVLEQLNTNVQGIYIPPHSCLQ